MFVLILCREFYHFLNPVDGDYLILMYHLFEIHLEEDCLILYIRVLNNRHIESNGIDVKKHSIRINREC